MSHVSACADLRTVARQKPDAPRALLPRLSAVRRSSVFFAGVVASMLPLLTPQSAGALSPESPEVKQVVAKAVAFLENHNGGAWMNYSGAKALVGMCILKQYKEADRNHPKVLEAVQAIRTMLRKGVDDPNHLVYDAGICLLFLLELDRDQYRPEMEGLRNLLIKAQQPNGGFGYPTDNGQTSGDISAVQYGVLGLWACQAAKLSVRIDHWDRAANFLLRVQDTSGGYGYKAVDPGHFERVAQPECRASLSAAGLGSLCICAHSLQLFVPEEVVKPTGPAALKKIEKTENQARTKNVNPAQVMEALALGRGYFGKNYTSDYAMKPESFIHYYMYAMERYKSFQADVDPKQKADNKWYDDGYALLAKTQDADGSWHTPAYQVPDTCFAILFLMRSTQKLIIGTKMYGGGVAQGGRGLPENADELVLGQDGIRAKPLKRPLTQLLPKLNPDDPQFEDVVDALEKKSLVEEGDLLSEMQKRLRRMAEGKSPEAKVAALRLLGRTRDLDNVPLLIEALKDPDPLIFRAANDALSFLARKFTGAVLYGGTDENARKEAIKKWKAWYREIRPDAESTKQATKGVSSGRRPPVPRHRV